MTRTPSPSHDPLHKKSRNCESTNTESECPRSVAAGHQVSFSHKITESSADLDAYHFQWQSWVNVVTELQIPCTRRHNPHPHSTHLPSGNIRIKHSERANALGMTVQCCNHRAA